MQNKISVLKIRKKSKYIENRRGNDMWHTNFTLHTLYYWLTDE